METDFRLFQPKSYVVVTKYNRFIEISTKIITFYAQNVSFTGPNHVFTSTAHVNKAYTVFNLKSTQI